MNDDQFSGKWKELKGEIRNQWGKLTDDEIESSKGNMTAISGLIQQRYGDEKETSSHKLKDMFAKYSAKAERAGEKAKDWIANKTENVKDDLRHSSKKNH